VPILRNLRQALGPRTRVLIRELKLLGVTLPGSCLSADGYVLCALSRTQAEAMRWNRLHRRCNDQSRGSLPAYPWHCLEVDRRVP
jgi:hypothetical protein